MCIWIFFYLQYSSLQLKLLPLLVLWQYQSDHYGQHIWVLSYYTDENIVIKENTILDIIINSTLCNITLKCTNIILSYIISNYTINHIKPSNIIKWLTVIQNKTDRKRNTNRLREWKKEIKRELELERKWRYQKRVKQKT